MRNTSAAITRRLLDPLFLQNQLRVVLMAFLASLVLNVTLGIGLFVSITHPPRVKHIYHDQFGKPRELIVTDRPYFSDSDVMNWAAEKVTNLYTLNYVQFSKQLVYSSQFFSTPAWNSWADAFRSPGNIQFIKEKHVFLTAALKTAPSVRSEGVSAHGDYEWHIAFPMYLKWENAAGSMTDTLAVSMTIRRTNDPLHPDGLEIAELNAPRAADTGG